MFLVSQTCSPEPCPGSPERSGADRSPRQLSSAKVSYRPPSAKSRPARLESAPRLEQVADGSRTRLVSDPDPRLAPKRLLDLHGRAGVFELLLEFRGFVLVDPFFDRLGRAFDQVLRLFEAETGDRAHLLD